MESDFGLGENFFPPIPDERGSVFSTNYVFNFRGKVFLAFPLTYTAEKKASRFTPLCTSPAKALYCWDPRHWQVGRFGGQN